MKFVLVGASGITAVQYDTSNARRRRRSDDLRSQRRGDRRNHGRRSRYNDSSTPEVYSSRGPVTLYFEPTPSTAPLASPEVLDKPDFAATDDVQNVFFGDPTGAGGFRFAGTSAAAPQAARDRGTAPAVRPRDLVRRR